MMENLLNWASSQMQGFEPVMEMVDLQPIVVDCINGILPSLQKKQIEIDNKIVNALTVYGDKNMIELVVRNLLNNALKFSNKQGLIEVYTTVEANGICALSISDKGLGLSQEKLDLINSNKVRSISSSLGTNKEKGTGLGLMLCKHFALLMKGSIRASSTKDQGTIVQLLLNSSPL
jgi:signal transduction histidine kinase